MKQLPYKMTGLWLSALGLAVLGGAFLTKYGPSTGLSLPALLAALVSVLLFAILGLRFVSDWMWDWQEPRLPARKEPAAAELRKTSRMIFFALLAYDLLLLLVVYQIWLRTDHQGTFREYLEVWRNLDSRHYMDIAREWYLSEGETGRLVQLVFLPGYPIVVRLFYHVMGHDLSAGLAVSALSFAGAGCVLYRLLRLDVSHRTAIRAVRYLCILPGVFFFAAPMSESLFLLLCCLSLYFARTGRWGIGGLFGGLAALTRSLGLTLVVPLTYFCISDLLAEGGWKKSENWGKYPQRFLSLLLVPVGFAVYCRINYLVSGNPFQFLEYQRTHWFQQLGWFFQTAYYQMELALGAFTDNRPWFFGLWYPNLLYGFGSLVLMIFAQRKMHPAYVAWFLVYFVIAYGATWLLSGPRYLVALMPIAFAMALITKNKKFDAVLSLYCLVMGVLYMYAFTKGWAVY